MFTVTILEESKSRLQAEVIGADHTVLNVVVQELWNDSTITVAAYTIDHPLVGKPKLVIEGSNPKKSLKEACQRVIKNTSSLKV